MYKRQDQLTIRKVERSLPSLLPGNAAITENNREIQVTGGGFTYIFSKKDGLLVSAERKGTSLFTSPMNWNLWRAPTDNDRYVQNSWKDAGFTLSLIHIYSSVRVVSSTTAVPQSSAVT